MFNLQSLGDRLVTFCGGAQGEWRVLSLSPVTGESLSKVERVTKISAPSGALVTAEWMLSGVASNVRYVDRPEKNSLEAKQAGLGRREASLAALIPIRKNSEWWALTQDERRQIFEEQSHHTEEGLKYLPAIARKLYHCRDIGEAFDFLTWFEYSPDHAAEFERLVDFLRKTPEWAYVDREVDIRLSRD